jgi:hypothetical protein
LINGRIRADFVAGASLLDVPVSLRPR